MKIRIFSATASISLSSAIIVSDERWNQWRELLTEQLKQAKIKVTVWKWKETNKHYVASFKANSIRIELRFVYSKSGNNYHLDELAIAETKQRKIPLNIKELIQIIDTYAGSYDKEWRAIFKDNAASAAYDLDIYFRAESLASAKKKVKYILHRFNDEFKLQGNPVQVEFKKLDPKPDHSERAFHKDYGFFLRNLMRHQPANPIYVTFIVNTYSNFTRPTKASALAQSVFGRYEKDGKTFWRGEILAIKNWGKNRAEANKQAADSGPYHAFKRQESIRNNDKTKTVRNLSYEYFVCDEDGVFASGDKKAYSLVKSKASKEFAKVLKEAVKRVYL